MQLDHLSGIQLSARQQGRRQWNIWFASADSHTLSNNDMIWIWCAVWFVRFVCIHAHKMMCKKDNDLHVNAVDTNTCALANIQQKAWALHMHTCTKRNKQKTTQIHRSAPTFKQGSPSHMIACISPFFSLSPSWWEVVVKGQCFRHK